MLRSAKRAPGNVRRLNNRKWRQRYCLVGKRSRALALLNAAQYYNIYENISYRYWSMVHVIFTIVKKKSTKWLDIPALWVRLRYMCTGPFKWGGHLERIIYLSNAHDTIVINSAHHLTAILQIILNMWWIKTW